MDRRNTTRHTATYGEYTKCKLLQNITKMRFTIQSDYMNELFTLNYPCLRALYHKYNSMMCQFSSQKVKYKSSLITSWDFICAEIYFIQCVHIFKSDLIYGGSSKKTCDSNGNFTSIHSTWKKHSVKCTKKLQQRVLLFRYNFVYVMLIRFRND